MAFVLADARTRLGIAANDASKDAAITAALNMALAAAETYCDRKFFYGSGVGEFIDFTGSRLAVARYPIDRVTVYAGDNPATPLVGNVVDYDVHNSAGIVVLRGAVQGQHLFVSYSGGYKVLPLDLEAALWMLFDGAYGVVGGGGAIVGAGDISSITVPDVGTVRFNEGQAASGSAASAGGGFFSDPFALLALYRRIMA
jgi:hypothetical protein